MYNLLLPCTLILDLGVHLGEARPRPLQPVNELASILNKNL